MGCTKPWLLFPWPLRFLWLIIIIIAKIYEIHSFFLELLKEKCCCLNGKSVVIYLCCKFSTSIIKKWYKFDNFVKNLNSWLFYKAREGTYWQKCRVSKNWKEAKLYKNKKIMDDPWRKVKEKDTKITNRHTENNRLVQRTLCLFFFFSFNFVKAFSVIKFFLWMPARTKDNNSRQLSWWNLILGANPTLLLPEHISYVYCDYENSTMQWTIHRKALVKSQFNDLPGSFNGV